MIKNVISYAEIHLNMDPFGNSEPDSGVFEDCPNCGQDKIYSQSEGILSETKYLCNHCGYEAEKSEVKKRFSDLYREAKKERERELDEKIDGERGGNLFTELAKELQSEKKKNIADPNLRKRVTDREDEGWEIEEITDSGNRVVMSSTKGGTIGGHFLTGVLTGLWTLGLGNVAYNKMSKKRNKERIVLRTDDEPNIKTNESDSASPTELIRELKQLNEEGVVSDSEFKEKKQELLDEM